MRFERVFVQFTFVIYKPSYPVGKIYIQYSSCDFNGLTISLIQWCR